MAELKRHGAIDVLERGLVALYGRVVFGSSGAVSTSDCKGFTVTKPSGVGLYRATLNEKYQRLLGASGLIDNATARKGQAFEVSNVDVGAASPIVDFQLSAGTRHISLPRKAADAAANTATAETMIGSIVEGATLLSAYVVPDAAVTADAANNATLTLRKRTSAGASATSIATLVTDVAGGSWTQYARKAFTVVTAGSANVCAVGSGISLEITKGGTGVQLPLLTIGLDFATAIDATSGDEAYFTLFLSNSGSRV